MSKIQTVQNRRWNRDNSWMMIAFVLVFGGIGTALLLASHAATPLQPSVRWTSQNGELVNINSNLCLGTPGTAQAANGTGYVIEGCNGASDQKWSITWGNGSGAVSTIVKNGYGQCLDDTGNSTHAGNPTQAWPCSGVVQQTWTTGYGDGSIRIHGLCLGVNGNSKGGGSTVIIMACNVPTPTASITAPGSGATLQGTATVTATASISGDSMASIKLTVGSSTLKTCTGTTSCSAAWNTAQVGNGSYTITATATGALGGSATTSRSVTVNNPAPSPPPGGGGGGTGGGGGGGGSTGGGSGTGDTGGSGGTITGDPSSGDTSGNTDTLDNSNSSDSIDISGDSGSTDLSTLDTSGSSDNSDSSSDTSGSSGDQQTNTGISGNQATHKSSGSAVAAVISGIVLVALIVFIIWRRRQLANQSSIWSYDSYGVPPTQTQAPQPAPTEPEHIDPHFPTFPREDPGQTAARVNWWLPDNERAKIAIGQAAAQPTTQKPADDNPPDIFEEGRRRLQAEEQEGHISHPHEPSDGSRQ